jgi:hypothetical protein
VRVVVFFTICLLTCLAHAQEPPAVGTQLPHGYAEPGTTMPLAVEPPVGACLGGECANVPAGPRRSYRTPRRARFAYTGAVLGTVSAGLVFSGALSIALADRQDSERITRGVWLGYVAVSTPIVALSAWLGRKGGSYRGYAGLRRVGWVAYGLTVSDGVLLWYGALKGYDMPAYLTISAGVLAVLALLPHALDALTTSRLSRARRFSARMRPSPHGLALAF